MAYHGGEFPAGVALGYRLLCSLRQQVSPLSRGGWVFYNGLGNNGPGITDAVDYCLRLRRDGGVFGDPSFAEEAEAPVAPGGGKYFFSFYHPEVKVSLRLKEGLLLPEFFTLSRKRHEEGISEEELSRLMGLRREMEGLLLSERGEVFFIEKQVPLPGEYEKCRSLSSAWMHR